MRNSRLIKIIQTLSPSEFRRFIDYIKSPYFNKNERLTKLIEAIHQSAPEFGEASLSKKQLFKVMYGKSVFVEQQVHDALSQLLRLLERFLAQEKFQEDASSEYVYLLSSLNQRNVDDHFSRVYKKAQKILLKQNLPSESHYYKQYLLNDVAVEFESKKRIRSSQDSFDEELLELNRMLDKYYLLTKLHFACEILNRKNIVRSFSFPHMLEEIQQFLAQEDHPYADDPIITIYYTIFQMLKDPDQTQHFNRLIVLLEQHVNHFTKNELERLYGHAQNYCATKINQGNSDYYQQLFRIYRQLLENDILIRDGYLAHWYMKNIVTIGLRLKEYDWVESFLNTYERKLHPEVKEHVYAFNKANLLFETNRYSEAKLLLQQVEFTDVLYHLSAKSILLKIHYEEKDDDSMSYLIQAFQVFLRRNKHLSKKHYQNHIHFIRFSKKLFHLHLQSDRIRDERFDTRLQKIESELTKTKSVAYLSWLKLKLRDLKGTFAQV